MKKLSRKLKEKAPGSLIQALLNDCSTSYDALETAHFRWAESMENPANTMNSSTDFVDIADARSWLDAVDLVYEPLISEATEYLAVGSTEDTSTLDSVLPPSGDTSDAVSTADEKTVTTDAAELQFTLSAASVERLRPPKISCMVFGSNPREWKLFACEFNTNVKAYFPDNERKLVSLLFKFTSHKAKSCVRSHVVSNSKTPFSDAWSELLSLFGTPAILAKYIISDLKNGPSVSSSNDFLEFDREIQHAINQLSRTSHESDILGHSIINDLLIRLPSSVHVRWNKLALKYKVAHDAYPDIFEFSKFIKLLAAESHDEYYGLDATKRRYLKSVCKQRESKKSCDVMSSSTFTQEVQNAAVGSSPGRGSNTKRSFPPNCKFCKKQRHALTSCPTFLALEHAGRWGDDLMASKICWKCLTYCGSPQNCSPVNDCDCGMPFHYLLHPPPCSAQTTQVPNQNDSGFVQTSTGFTVLPVLEVVVGNVLTYALQDSGSTASYITQDLVDKLKLDSSPSENFTRTIIGNTDTNHRIVKTVKIRGKGHSVYRTITNVFVCQQIPATTRRIALCVKQFPYLDGIDLSAQRAEGVGMLVGADSGLIRPIDFKSHPELPDENPYAVKYPLGWAIAGHLPKNSSFENKINDCLVSMTLPQSMSFTSGKNETNTEYDLHHCKYPNELPSDGKCKYPSPETAYMVSTEKEPSVYIGCDSDNAESDLCSGTSTFGEINRNSGGKCNLKVNAPSSPLDFYGGCDSNGAGFTPCSNAIISSGLYKTSGGEYDTDYNAPSSPPGQCFRNVSRSRKKSNISLQHRSASQRCRLNAAVTDVAMMSSRKRRLRRRSRRCKMSSEANHGGEKAPQSFVQHADVTAASSSLCQAVSSAKNATTSPAADIGVLDVMNHVSDVMEDGIMKPVDSTSSEAYQSFVQHADVIAASSSLCQAVSSAKNATTSPAVDISVLDVMNYVIDVMKDETIKPVDSTSSNTIISAVKTPQTPDFTHQEDVHATLKPAPHAAAWSPKFQPFRVGGRRYPRRRKLISTSISRSFDGKISSSAHHTFSSKTVYSSTERLTSQGPEARSKTAAQDSMINIQERSLSRSSPSDAMVAIYEQHPTLAAVPVSKFYIQERNHINVAKVKIASFQAVARGIIAYSLMEYKSSFLRFIYVTSYCRLVFAHLILQSSYSSIDGAIIHH